MIIKKYGLVYLLHPVPDHMFCMEAINMYKTYY